MGSNWKTLRALNQASMQANVATALESFRQISISCIFAILFLIHRELYPGPECIELFLYVC